MAMMTGWISDFSKKGRELGPHVSKVELTLVHLRVGFPLVGLEDT
jgi:hypothetical protein